MVQDRRKFIRDVTASSMFFTIYYPFTSLGIKEKKLGDGLVNNISPALPHVHSGQGLNSVVLEDNGKALVNPDMGLTFFYYSNQISDYGSRLVPSDTLNYIPGLTTVYFRFPWSFIEQEEGKFNWELVDSPAQRWVDKGLKTAFRITAFESWMCYATPEWVKNAGAKGEFVKWGNESRSKAIWRPDFCDPVFLKKLESLIIAMAERYDGNPDVAYVDIGSFGVWGEGHDAGHSAYCTTEEGMKKHIDLHCKYFKKTMLVINDDFAGTTDYKKEHFPIIDYAFSKGITLRDDSIMVQPPPDSWYSAGMAQRFWPKLPVILEAEHYGSSKRRNAWSERLLLKAIEDYHASYISVQWWPLAYYEENKDAIDKINLRLGYRIQLRKITWSAQVRIGRPFELTVSLANAGVAPCYPGGYPCITLKDNKGGLISVLVNQHFNVKTLEVGEIGEALEKTIQCQFTIAPNFNDPVGVFARNITPGIYDLYFSVGALDGTPKLALPYENDDGHKRYKLGEIELLERISI